MQAKLPMGTSRKATRFALLEFQLDSRVLNSYLPWRPKTCKTSRRNTSLSPWQLMPGRYRERPNMSKTPVKFNQTVLRDGHQSLAATRMKTEQMLPVVEKLDNMGFNALETWGGAIIDSCLRYLAENPFDRLRALKKLSPKTPASDAAARSEHRPVPGVPGRRRARLREVQHRRGP